MIRAVALSLLLLAPQGPYPLGPFASVSWADAFHHTTALREMEINGRTYYTPFRGLDAPSGVPAFDRGAFGTVSAQHIWLAAIPLDSGGSGGAFLIAVFRWAGERARYIGYVNAGADMGAKIYDGELHITAPESDNRIRVLSYTVQNGMLKRISTAIASKDTYFKRYTPQYYVVGEVTELPSGKRQRYVMVRGLHPGRYAVGPNLHLGDLKLGKKMLFVCHLNVEDKLLVWTISAAYPYIGGLD